MSTQSNSPEKTQENNECDSGFESRLVIANDDDTSRNVTARPRSLIDEDDIKDLLEHFEGISHFDQVPKKFTDEVPTILVDEATRDSDAKSDRSSSDTENAEDEQDQALNCKQLLQLYTPNVDGDTQLHVSVILECTDIALWAIDCAPTSDLLDLKNDDVLTALHLAAMTKQSTIVRRLVLAGADVTITTPRLYQPWTSCGNAAIHMACEADDYESVRALTEPIGESEERWLARHNKEPPILGRDLELTNYDGVTPMHIAIKKGNLEIVKQLVKCGAKINTIDPLSGFTNFHLAIRNNQRSIIEYMAKEHKSCINVPTRGGTYSYEIALHLDERLAADLMKWGALPIVQESDYESYSSSDSEKSSDADSNDYSH